MNYLTEGDKILSGLNLDVIGKKFPEVTFKYNWKDVVLYALGIGAQVDELEFLYEGSSGGVKVFPSYACIVGAAGLQLHRLGKIAFSHFVHGEKNENVKTLEINRKEIIRLSEPRIHPQKESERDEDARKLIEGFRKINKGPVTNIMTTLANYSKLYNRWRVFGNHVLFKSTLPPRDREILILRIG